MAIKQKKPPMRETVGAMYTCFNTMDEDNQWTNAFETDVEKLKSVKSIKVTENADKLDCYGSGEVYDSDSVISTIDVEIQALAFSDETIGKMRGDNQDTGGLILSGGKRVRPFFAFGKVVKLKHGGFRYDWYPKCKLTENTDDADTSEDKQSEQTDTIKITAYPFNEDGDIVSKVSSEVNFPEGLTEDKFFTKPILTKEDLASAISG